jgi:hypothetical protein
MCTRTRKRSICASGEDEERIGELEAVALDRDLALLHRLEQRALGLRRGAVDLVREEHVGEDGACAEREGPVPRREHVRPRDVGGQEIGRELDAPDRTAERLGERFHQRGLGDPGDALEQDVAACEERDEHHVDGARVADVDAADLAPHLGQAVPRCFDFADL